MTDIVQRLEKDKWHITTVDVEDAIAEIARLRAEAEALRKALQCSLNVLDATGAKDEANAARAALDATKGTT